MDEIIKSNERQRDIVLDCLKGFAIFLVVWGHCIQYFSSTHYSVQPIYRIIYSFHMPLFMALVGYFAVPLLNIQSFVKVFWKRFKQLIIPAITFIIIMCCADIYPTEGVFHGFKRVVKDLWFLKSAFVCTLLFYCSAKNKKYRTIGIILSLILSQFIILWHYQVNTMYPCFVVGVLLHQYRSKIEENGTKIALITGVLMVILLIPWNERFWEMPTLTLNLSSPEFAEYWGKILYRIIIGINGTVLFFTLFVCFIDRILPDKPKKILQTIGMATLGIYIIQTWLVEKLMAKMLNFDGVGAIVYNFVLTPFFAIVALCVCMVLIRLIQESHICSRLLLGK